MVLGTTSSEVPVSTMAWQPWVQATASPPRETLGRKVQGEAKRRLVGVRGAAGRGGCVGSTCPW